MCPYAEVMTEELAIFSNLLFYIDILCNWLLKLIFKDWTEEKQQEAIVFKKLQNIYQQISY